VVVARAVFDTAKGAGLSMPGITAPPLEMDKQVGGELFGAVLNRFSYFEALGLALMLAGLAGWLLGHRHVRRSTWVIAALWAMVAGLAAVDAGWVRPQVWAQREVVREQAASHAADREGAEWPERAAFDRLHQLSETLGHCKGYVLLAMILVTAWRGLAEKRAAPADKAEVMRRTMGAASSPAAAGDRVVR
jgi:hypothetical protein